MDYVLVECEKSVCPKCQQKVTLLSHWEFKKDMFYVCWPCHKVWQVGVGEIPFGEDVAVERRAAYFGELK